MKKFALLIVLTLMACNAFGHGCSLPPDPDEPVCILGYCF